MKACKFIKKRLQHRFFPVKFAKFLRTPFFTEHVRWLLLEISHELSFYSIWEQWMMSFRGTCGPSNAYFILFCLFRFFLFLSFSLILFVDSTAFWLWVSLSILKIKQWSCFYVRKWNFEGWVTSVLFSNSFHWLDSVWEKLDLHLTSTCLLN